jgi:predicted nucleotidyltransferase
MSTADNTALREVSEETLREVVRRIVETAQPEKIILFGSAATGRMGPNSDLDLLVVKSGEYHHVTVAQRIYRSLRDLDYAKDIIVVTPQEVERYGDCPALVIYPALQEGRVLFERPAL